MFCFVLQGLFPNQFADSHSGPQSHHSTVHGGRHHVRAGPLPRPVLRGLSSRVPFVFGGHAARPLRQLRPRPRSEPAALPLVLSEESSHQV